MTHITERLAEFIFEELSAQEMAEAKHHLLECANCREQVARFQQTLAMLRTAPDVDPPRDIVFEFEKPAARRSWSWFPAAAAIAAVLVMMIALAGRVHVQWQASQLTIAFGQPVSPAQSNEAVDIATEVQRIQGRLTYLESRQQAMQRDTTVIATMIQPVARAQRSPAGD